MRPKVYDRNSTQLLKTFGTVDLTAWLQISWAVPAVTQTLNARDADVAPLTLAAAQTAKQQCISVCRARYRDCQSLKQIQPC